MEPLKRNSRVIFVLIFAYFFTLISDVQTKPLTATKTSPKVVIVGAGVSGIAAATRLLEKGITDITLLEAEPRWGGRIESVPFGANVIDLGAQWCHGQGENPVYNMGKKYDLFDITYDPPNYHFSKPNGEELPIDHADTLMSILITLIKENRETLGHYDGSLGDFVIQRYYEILEAPMYKPIPQSTRGQVLEYYHRYMNADMASDYWYDVSGPGYVDYLEHEGYINVNWKDNGYGTVFKLLLKSYPKPGPGSIDIDKYVKLNTAVKNIDYDNPNGKVVVKTQKNEIIEADQVIVTVSVGVLQANYKSLFTPPVPKFKENAIKGLILGTVDKLFFEFDKPFWPENWTGLKIVWTPEELVEINKRPDSYIKDIVSFDRVDYQPNLLLGWIVGESARKMETRTEDEVREGAMFILRKFLPKMNIPNPKTFLRNMWSTKKNFLGSYSYQSMMGHFMHTNATELAKPLYNSQNKPVLRFAGEATSKNYYSTVHGAIEQGWQEADAIASLYGL